MIRRTLTVLAFAALAFVALELTYRVYVVGLKGLSPAQMSTMTTILESGLIKASDNVEVQFELKPNLDTQYRGVPFTTNSDGLADREYARNKPRKTYRVAVIGSSWTMPSGVEHQFAWHAVVEQELNARSTDRDFEFINFAVELYGLGEIVGTARHRILDYDPDLILLGMTSLSAYFVRDPDPQPFVVPATRNPFYESFVLRTLDAKLGLNLYSRSQARETLNLEMDTFRQQAGTGIREIAAVAETNNIDLAIVWLGFTPLAKKFRADMFALSRELDVPLVLGYEPIHMDKEVGYGGNLGDPRFQLPSDISHPNAAGHARIAEKVATELFSAY